LEIDKNRSSVFVDHRVVRHVSVAFALLLALRGPGSPVPAALGHDQAIADLRHLHAALRELHPGLERYGAPADLEAAVARVSEQIGRSVTHRELFRLLASLSPAIRDGHTRFHYPPLLQRQARSWPLLPLHVRAKGGARLEVARACGASPDWAGREIVAIDGIPAPELLEQALAMRPRDGFGTGHPRWSLGRAFGFSEALNLLGGPVAERRVRLAAPDESVALRAVPADVLESTCPAPALERTEGLAFRGESALLTIPSFVPDLAGRYQTWFERIARGGARALVLDLRDNGGGLDSNGSLLFAHLGRAPFRYYDRIVVRTLDPRPPFAGFAALLRPWRIERASDGTLQFTGHRCLGLQPPASPGFDGPVVVLMNGGTYSAASEFAAIARANRRATFVGEEAGGAANGNTAGVSADVVLPHSGIRVQVPMMRYEVAARGLPPGRGVVPDLEVVPTAAELLAGRDGALEQALLVARRLAEEER
jgi:hypothetical protein